MTDTGSLINTIRFFEKTPVFILILFFSLITGLKIMASWLILSPQIFEDELVYDILAKQIYNGVLLASHQPYPPWPFSPGYSFFVSLAYLLTPDKYVVYHYMMVINAVLTSTILFPAYYLLKSATPKKIALFGAILIALLPAVTMNSFVLMSEALFIPLTLFSVWFVQRSLSSARPGIWDILAGISIFLLFFTRAAGVSMIFGLIAAMIWILKNREIPSRRPLILKLIYLGAPGLFVYLVWVTDQLFMKGALPEGYSIQHYISLLMEAFASDPGHLLYVILLHLDYLLLGSFVILPLLAFFPGYHHIKSIIRRSSEEDAEHENHTDLIRTNTPVLLYVGVSSALLFLFGIAHMSNLSYEYSLCGRYVDPIIPIIMIGGVIGLYQETSRGEVAGFLKGALVYLVMTVILTSMVMLHFAHQPNNNAAIFYLYSLSEKMVPISSLLLGISLVVLVAGVIKVRRGMLHLLVLIIFLAAFSSVPIFLWEVQTSEKTGSLLPFCQEVNRLCNDSAGVLWDSSAETDEWDRVVYYTLKFWLGDRVSELSQNTGKSELNRYLITKTDKGEPVLTSGAYRVIPLSP